MTQTLVVQPPNPETVQPHSMTFAQYLSPEARAMVLHDDEDLAVAASIINDIKTRTAEIEAARVSVTQPINQGLRAFNAFFAPAKAAAAAARELWDTKIRIYHTAQQAKRLANEAALAAAVAAQDEPAAAQAVMALVPAPRVQGLAVVPAWDYEERNHDIVPTSLTRLDARLVGIEIGRQLAEGVAEPAIPGLRVFRRDIVKAVG